MNFKLAKKLKELGVDQTIKKGDWYYYEGRKGIWLCDSELRVNSLDKKKIIKSHSFEDLMEIAPRGTQLNKCLAYGHWQIEWGKNWDKESTKMLEPGVPIVDTMAKMIIHLLEKNI